MKSTDRSGGRKHHFLCVLCMGNGIKEGEKGIGTGRRRGGFGWGLGWWGGEEEGKSWFRWLRSGSVTAFRKVFVLRVAAHLSSPCKS